MGLEAALLATAVAGLGASIHQGEKSRKSQNQAADQARTQARTAESQQNREVNRASARAPNVGALLSGNQQAAAAGGSSTLLSGVQGVDPNALTLGKKTLLGGG